MADLARRAPDQSFRSRPESVNGRLLSHSRKQAFAVLLHWKDCAHSRRTWAMWRFSKAAPSGRDAFDDYRSESASALTPAESIDPLLRDDAQAWRSPPLASERVRRQRAGTIPSKADDLFGRSEECRFDAPSLQRNPGAHSPYSAPSSASPTGERPLCVVPFLGGRRHGETR